jgi:hypothetical protein
MDACETIERWRLIDMAEVTALLTNPVRYAEMRAELIALRKAKAARVLAPRKVA